MNIENQTIVFLSNKEYKNCENEIINLGGEFYQIVGRLEKINDFYSLYVVLRLED
jgi:hypothetical protein